MASDLFAILHIMLFSPGGGEGLAGTPMRAPNRGDVVWLNPATSLPPSSPAAPLPSMPRCSTPGTGSRCCCWNWCCSCSVFCVLCPVVQSSKSKFKNN
jgi:hypothetical protein